MSARRLAAPAPVAAALAFGLFATSFLQRFDGLTVPAYDTAFFEQVAWNVAHGNGWSSGFYPGNFLGLHFEPLLAGPALAQLAWPDARGLSLIGLAGLSLSAPAAYAFAQELLAGLHGGRLVAAALAAPLPIWPPIQEAARAGFHTEYLALPLLFLCGWAGLRRRWWLCSATALAALRQRRPGLRGCGDRPGHCRGRQVAPGGSSAQPSRAHLGSDRHPGRDASIARSR